MHVRRLHLQGFKTFASKTVFEFEPGIAAIVGPNGSGKSNLADALRWVLGEQSYSTLRGRRTEDVIFSGSSVRPPMGMAEVSLLLDNEDGHLQVEFPEVEITRRAHRTGVNEYYLNRRRVRLQDIEEALGGLTSSYVVIHQGLVDEALSLRPRERRLLLEEAAEVRRYHERRQKAQERLERTQVNMTRISDLRNELTPRLHLLDRQSQQARQRGEVEAALRQTLRAWYRWEWEKISTALQKAWEEERAAQSRLTQAHASLERAVAEAAHLRQSFQETQRQQEENRREEAELRRRETALRQELAQEEGEQRALQRYCQELAAEIERWREEARQQEERRRANQEARMALAGRAEQLQTELRARQMALEEAESGLRAHQQEKAAYLQRLQDIGTRLRDTERRLEFLSLRQDALAHEEVECLQALDRLKEEEVQVQAAQAAAEQGLAEREKAWQELLARRDAVQEEIEQGRETLRRTGEALEQTRLRLAEARARWNFLSQAGPAGSGAAFLQQWARQQGRPALTSAIAHLSIPPALVEAVEAALGAHVAALLAADWEEAQAALEALATATAGRASLVVPGEQPPATSGRPSIPVVGNEGPLLDHLAFPDEYRPAWQALLGQTLLAEDLTAARQIAPLLPAGWTVVTRRGQVLTPSGIASGGRLPAGQSALAQEQERQQLSSAIDAEEIAFQELKRAYQSAQQYLDQRTLALSALDRLREEHRLQIEEQARSVRELARDLLRIREDQARRQERLKTLRADRQQLEEDRRALQSAYRQWEEEQAILKERVQEAQTAEQAAQETCLRAREQWQESRTAWAVVLKEQESQHALEEMVQRSSERLQQQIAEGEQRLSEAQHQVEDKARRAEILRAEMEQVATSASALLATTLAAPLPLDDLARREEEVARCRHEVLEWEGAAGRAAVEVQRQRDRLKEVLRRGLDEVGPEASAYGPAGEALLNAMLENPPDWARAPLDPSASPEELERRIAHLREEARRIGPVNPLAEEEYRETLDRYNFLGQQLQDLHDAARSLQQVIAELDQAMEDRFQETFEAINREFQNYFARLFGGGTASLRLVQLEEEDGGLTGLGVEIVARPPGKRAHSLALLSGGERALTSAALLFAILKVNPRPFCLLDEVDAMLDEANVGRFRECLEELAARTQFIVITHNRGTIQAARILYGVSLAEDGTSRVLSLRMDEALAASEGKNSLG